MKCHLLLLFSLLLLLLTLSQPGGRVNGMLCAKQRDLTETLTAGQRQVKRTCAKKCLKHQTHSEQQSGTNFAPECSHPVYAVLTEMVPAAILPAALLQQVHLPAGKKHLPPSLEAEPDPPRFS
ncbi:hypothetical protein [Pontibacter sp. HJ8]